ncbi:5170_t:CDS:2 [Cetraspora pellucida]|uniref:5170_t:CDS:1 n=1 Tax=Cetraspora pellucida TaxID=1433469 RepID=A0ACA9MSN7_9GLOM|nr:5170_t:CDS:2 [Cetraspora pellucida]
MWFIHRIWSTDRFKTLEWKRLKNIELKSFMTLLMFMMLPMQAILDATWTVMIYDEGYIPYPFDGTCPKDGDIIRKGTLFLIQSFWSYMASKWGGKPFMNSWEFRIYIAWGLVSIIIFPGTKWLIGELLSNPNSNYNVVEIRNQRKLFTLLRSIQSQKSSQETVLRIKYFMEMNGLLILGASITGPCIFIVDIYAIIGPSMHVSKFFLDLSTLHMNLGFTILYITMILIVYPRYYITGLYGSKALSEKSLQKITISVDKTIVTTKRPSSNYLPQSASQPTSFPAFSNHDDFGYHYNMAWYKSAQTPTINNEIVLQKFNASYIPSNKTAYKF